MTDKVDLKKSLDAYRAKVGQFRVLDVPELQYLMIDGHGDPNTSPVFAEAVETLYPVAYALKFASKRGLGRDFVVMPLEGQWWADDMDSFTAARDKSRWDWTLMIMQPDWIGRDMFAAAVEQAGTKKGLSRLEDLRLESLSERRCVQTLLRRRGGRARADARRVHPRQRAPHGRQAPRDLPQRHPPGRAREAAHDPPAAGGGDRLIPGFRPGGVRRRGRRRGPAGSRSRR
jgi:hypothetical protein